MSGRTTFNENEWEQFYYPEVISSKATEYLASEPIGTFLIRKCNTDGRAYVICIRENEGVNQYKINVSSDGTEYFLREESKFQSMLSLLGFYKRNLFLSSQLGLPIDPSKIPAAPGSDLVHRTGPAKKSEPSKSQPEVLAKVIKRKLPNVHETEYIDLRVGDIVTIKRMSPNGDLFVEYEGQEGKYPFVMVEVLQSSAVSGNRNTL